jgi:predicted Zn-ribbon and HTH transcriptional regulator
MPTLRQELITLLRAAPMDLRDLAAALDIREADAADHLQHVARSLRTQGVELQTSPAYCRQCDFEFRKRERFTRPGRCPRCKGGRIQGAVYHLVD